MRIDRLDQKTILVAMAQQDMRDYALDFAAGADAARSREGLKALMRRVGEECGLNSRGRSFLVEALPARDGCLLIISVHPSRRRKYRFKRHTLRTVCVFDDADILLDWLALKPRFSYTVYRYEDRWALIPSITAKPSALVLLCEYGRILTADAPTLARIREYGTEAASVIADPL